MDILKYNHKIHGGAVGLATWYMLKGKMEQTPQIGLSVAAGWLAYHIMTQNEQDDRHSGHAPHHLTPHKSAFKVNDGHTKWHPHTHHDQVSGNIGTKTHPKWINKDPVWTPFMDF